MARYQIIFEDSKSGPCIAQFDDFHSAANFWQAHADTPTYTAGQLYDEFFHEVIWEFDES